MNKISEVTVFTNGPAEEFRTWSNVPYLLTRALINHGIRVNNVDIGAIPVLENIYNSTFRIAWKFFNPTTTFSYFRSGLHFRLTKFFIKQAARRFPGSQADIFLTYSFPPLSRSGSKSVLLCDWPYEISIEYFRERRLDFLENRSAERERRIIEKADIVISLFHTAVDLMKARFPDKMVYCLGCAVNMLEVADEPLLPFEKMRSMNLLFIGDTKYTKGLRTLLDAFTILRKDYPHLILSIVGYEPSLIKSLPDGVTVYGYLDKGDESQRSQYYSLLKQAKIVINTTPKWGGLSSILEALACYTPVIIAPFDEVHYIFNKKEDFITFCEPDSPELLTERINEILGDRNYEELSRGAHNAVVDMTWDNYVARLLSLLESHM